MKYLKIKDDGVQIEITVTPNARQTEIVGLHNDKLKIKIHAPPVDGKANQEVIRFFAKLIKRKKNAIQILRGEKSSNKSIFIAGVSLQIAKSLIEEVISDLM